MGRRRRVLWERAWKRSVVLKPLRNSGWAPAQRFAHEDIRIVPSTSRDCEKGCKHIFGSLLELYSCEESCEDEDFSSGRETLLHLLISAFREHKAGRASVHARGRLVRLRKPRYR
jgi:hypothetical protein